MAITDRQNKLLKAEDWKRIYQTFRNADFKSYDFDNLRRTMINYLRENYPEDFNDYIESSEYIALIDLIAFLGQNISYRVDLNARDNFLELAERRESVLRHARLLSYNPKRNKPANGLLKLVSVSTTESIVDSNNLNLANQSILWNDTTNTNWREQYTRILNAALPVQNGIGKPLKAGSVNGVTTQLYRFNSTSNTVPVYEFSKAIDNKKESFEVVSTNFDNDSIYEEAPLPGNNLAFLYRDNGRGPGSSNSGYFLHFRQGKLLNNQFNLEVAAPHETVDVNTANINNDDVWLYKLNADGNESDLWNKVDAVEGNNIVYNSLEKNVKDIYTVLTKVNDTVSLVFSDGIFGNIPKGQFRIYYRQSANSSVRIVPAEFTGINVVVPYISKAGKAEKISLVLELQNAVTNASTSETNESIKQNAPSNYYTQDRLITGEDYNVGPLSVSQEIVKTKSVNRTSSGVSRYFDLRDSTGKYSNTNLYGNDGIIYREYMQEKINFEFVNQTDIEFFARNTIIDLIKDSKMRNYYLDQYPRNQTISNFELAWNKETFDLNRCSGRFIDSDTIVATLGSFTSGLLTYVKPGSYLKFEAPTGYYFDSTNNNKLVLGNPTTKGAILYKWVKVISVFENGTVNDPNTNLGPVILNDNIPTNSKLVEIIPVLNKVFTDDTINLFVEQMFAFKRFGLRYDFNKSQWDVILDKDLTSSREFSLSSTGDISGRNLDGSWLILFETNGVYYTVTYRGLRYVFSSLDEIRFYFDKVDKIYDSRTQKIVKDKIQLLNINNKPLSLDYFTTDIDWQIVSDYINIDNYVDSTKVEIDFYDTDDDGIVDDPDIFTQFVAVDNNTYVYEKKMLEGDAEAFYAVDNSVEGIVDTFEVEQNIGALSQYTEGTVFYFRAVDLFKKLTGNRLVITDEYRAFIGRDNIKFRYYHAANENRRLDPSVSNMIDTFLLTRSYDTEYRKWLTNEIVDKPLPPSSDELFIQYGQEINKRKSISDEVIYHPVKYKALFGNKAAVDLQAKIKIVKNNEQVLNDNDVKARVITAINTFFSLENWDFGETFYFSELSTYIVSKLSPDIASIVLVPVQENQSFGSLYEIKAESNEIFVSAATVNDIEIIDAITATRLKATGQVVTATNTENVNIQSSTLSE
jgi:hypothetical protein